MPRIKKKNYHPLALVESKEVGKRTRVWGFAHIMSGAIVGEDCNICNGVFIERGCRIGNHVTIKNHVSIWDGVVVEDEVFVGPNAVFTNDYKPISRNPEFTLIPTRVKRGACIGANATIICGHSIGRHAFIGAGAVVCEDIPDYGLYYGNPAKLKGFLCSCREKLLFRNRIAHCKCGKKFKKNSKNKISLIS